ncbi:hypothetical protein DPMN_000210 [Dreissena polymorpha]|uniref:Uncharacterized protein n=1 Tax=Dreissena polymorpha TaxID=45954 RepID=A0A9D4MHQ8_DREPO|nr:hypothetical protein DPMN_000210 [Dreissena polymorpha]
MKLHRYIDHDSQMTPIDFEVTSLKSHTFLMSKQKYGGQIVKIVLSLLVPFLTILSEPAPLKTVTYWTNVSKLYLVGKTTK